MRSANTPQRCVILAWAVVLVFIFISSPLRADIIHLDFSAVPEGPFDGTTFTHRGVTFEPGHGIGFISGGHALVSKGWGDQGPFAHAIRAYFTTPTDVLNVRVELAITAASVCDVQFETFDPATFLVTRTELRNVSPQSGFVSIETGPIPRHPDFFQILSKYVRSQPDIGSEFAIRSVTITTVPVPTPQAYALFAIGVVYVFFRKCVSSRSIIHC